MAKKEKSYVSQRWRGLLILIVSQLGRILRPFEGRMFLWAYCLPYMRAHPRAHEAALLTEVEHFRMELAGHKVEGWTIGNEKKRVLLMHGWCGNVSQLAPWVAGLRAQGFSVIAVNAPAHGSSPGMVASMDTMAKVLLAADEKFGPFAGVVAHSFGGLTVSRALQRGLRAERITYIAPPSGASYYFMKMLKVVRIPKRRWPKIIATVHEEFGTPLTGYDMKDVWRDLTVPLFVVHDRDDKEVPLSCHEDWLEAVPHVEATISEGLGHRRILADPDVIEKGIAFLTQESSGRQPEQVASKSSPQAITPS